MRRERLPALAVTLLLGLLAGLVWLAHHPGHPLLARAAGWPAIGPAARAFREHYLPRPVGAESAPVGDHPERIVLTVEVPEPDVGAGGAVGAGRDVDILPAPAEAASIAAGPVDRSPEPPRPLLSTEISHQRLERVRSLLGAVRTEGRLGPYRWIGPLPPPPRWSAAAAALDDAFAARTGLRPRGVPAETVVVFADRERYRQLLGSEPLLRGLDPDGHALAGMAVIVAADLDDPVAEAVLIHELTHLVSRRALGPALPAWLAEGLAEDLAWTAFEPASGFDFGQLRAGVTRKGRTIRLDGAPAALERLVRALDQQRLPSLTALVAVGAPSDESMPPLLRYSQSLWFVRYLFENEREAGLRDYLAGVAAGDDVSRNRLEWALGGALEDLDADFWQFVRERKQEEVDAAIEALSLPGETLVPFQDEAGPSGSSSRQDNPPPS